MSVEAGVLDANVLAYAVNADAPQHAASRAFARRCQRFFGNPLRHLTNTLRIIFAHRQPAPGCGRVFFNGSIKGHLVPVGTPWSVCAADPGAGGRGLDATAPTPPCHWRRCIRFTNRGDHAGEWDTADLHF